MKNEENEKNDPYQGVEIQKLPTIGRPLSYKTWKQGYRPKIRTKVRFKNSKKLQRIVYALSED